MPHPKKLKKRPLIYWVPRFLSLFFVLFLSVFALDVFNEYSGFAVITPLVIHLIPSFVLLVLVGISWKHNLFGAAAFFGFALFYMYMVGLNRHWSWYVAISGPTALIGVLYLINWLQEKKKN